MIVSVLWPCWEWGPAGQRSLRYLTTSFAEDSVKRDTRKHRDLIVSEWYRTLWPDVELIRTGEMSFANRDMGTREGSAFGSLTSKRGDRLIIDDPHSTKTAESDAERERTVRQFQEGSLNRLNDQARSAIVVVMQRLHEKDISGAILSRKIGFEHLCLPMEFETERRCRTSIGFEDPRSYDGELLDPVRFPREIVDRDLKAFVYSWAGQYQQRPAPREGGLFKRRWFEIVGAVPAGASRVRKWDLAGTKDGGDWTVGLLMARDLASFVYIEDVVRFQGSPAEVEAAIINTAHLDRARFGMLRVGLNQDPGQAGKAQISHLTRQLQGFVVESERETGSKETRAAPLASQAEAGNVKIVAGAWNEAFFSEIEVFPAGAHDDQVDAASEALRMLSEGFNLNTYLKAYG